MKSQMNTVFGFGNSMQHVNECFRLNFTLDVKVINGKKKVILCIICGQNLSIVLEMYTIIDLLCGHLLQPQIILYYDVDHNLLLILVHD